jgi:hypothetical protein
MKLTDLHPEFQGLASHPDLYQLSFDCPLCGAPWRCTIKAMLNGDPGPQGVWAWTAAPFSNIPAVLLDWNTVTVKPSVRYEGIQAHGKKRPCNAHFTITKGQVDLA